MDSHRLSALLEHSKYSLWRCGNDTQLNYGWRNFYEDFSLVLYYRPTNCIFHVDCDMRHGFTVSLAKNCWTSHTAENTYDVAEDFFVYSSLESPKSFNNCKLKRSSVLNVGFNDCGQAIEETEAQFNSYTTYIHHQTRHAGVIITQWNPIKISCKISYVTIETGNGDVSDTITVVSGNSQQITISHEEAKLKADFGLQLDVGRWSPPSTVSSSSSLNLGEKIGVQLLHRDTFNRFQISNCDVSANGKTIKLYDGVCPLSNVDKIKLVRYDSIKFYLNSFIMDGADSLTFTCQAHIYPGNYTLKTCDDDRRKREANQANIEFDVESKSTLLSATVKIGNQNVAKAGMLKSDKILVKLPSTGLIFAAITLAAFFGTIGYFMRRRRNSLTKFKSGKKVKYVSGDNKHESSLVSEEK